MAASAIAKTSKYTYRSTGGGNADVSIEYSADLSALSRLEVGPAKKVPFSEKKEERTTRITEKKVSFSS